VPCREATREELERVHTHAHVQRVAATAGRTVRFDPDTQAGPDSYAAALRAAGAVTDAALRVRDRARRAQGGRVRVGAGPGVGVEAHGAQIGRAHV